MNLQQDAIIQYDDEIDLAEIFSILWGERKYICLITLCFTFSAIFFSLITPNEYQAKAVMAPSHQDAGGLSSALDKFGGLASLAGINIGDNIASEANVSIEIIQSRSFIEQYIKQSGIAIEVMAANGWDAENNRLLIDRDIYDPELMQWTRKPPRGRQAKPSSWEVFEEFSEKLTISQDKSSAFVTIGVESYSPYIAKQWVDNYILAANLYLQQRKLQKIEKNIDYLEQQIAMTSVAEMREIFFTLIEEQVKSKMLVEASPDYAFTVVSEAMIPEEHLYPKRLLVVVLGAMLGIMFGVIVAFIRNYWFNKIHK